MSQEERRSTVDALRRAQEVAFGPDEYVEQESFVRASEILALAERAGVGPGRSVLDLCCGVAGPGRFVTRELGCVYLGVDSSESAVAIAAERARDLHCRFEVWEVPPLPPGTFEVVLLLETMLAFRDKRTLLEEIAGVLPAGGRFAFTLEEGAPLTESERAGMPAADTVWLTPLDEMHTQLARAGLEVRWEENWSESHRKVAAALTDAYADDSTAIASRIGRRALHELLAGHRQWTEWLAAGRVRKFGLVAESVRRASATRPSTGRCETASASTAPDRRRMAAPTRRSDRSDRGSRP